MGWIPPDALKAASRVRWLHSPNVGPFVGYYYRELIEHPLTITNPGASTSTTYRTWY